MRLHSATTPKTPSSPLLRGLEKKNQVLPRQYQNPSNLTNNTTPLNFSISTFVEKRKAPSPTTDDVCLAAGLKAKLTASLPQKETLASSAPQEEALSSSACRPKRIFQMDAQDESLQKRLFNNIRDEDIQLEANADWEAFKGMSVPYQNKVTTLLKSILVDEPDLFNTIENDETIPRRHPEDRLYKGDKKRGDILQLAYLLHSIGWSWNGIAKVTGMCHTNLAKWVKVDKNPPPQYTYHIESDQELFTIKLTNPRLSSWTHPVRLYLMMLLNKSNLSPKQFLKTHPRYTGVAQKSALYNWKKEDAIKRPEFWKQYSPKRTPRQPAIIEKIKNDEHLFEILKNRKKNFPDAVKEYIVAKRRESGLPVDVFLNSPTGKRYGRIVKKSALYKWEKEWKQGAAIKKK